MSEEIEMSRFEHLRADVPKRRSMYWAFLWTAIVVFIVSIVDILWLDEVLYYAVLASYAILFIWGIVLLFSRRFRDDAEGEEMDWGDEPTSSDWRRDGRVEHLRCTNCRHVFGFDMKSLDDDKAHVAFNCPECGTAGLMPRPDANVVEAVVPGGGMHGPRFECKDCSEQWAVGAIGHEPKADVRFDACPHCQSSDIGRLAA